MTETPGAAQSPGVPEWDALGIPVDDFAEPLDAETDHTGIAAEDEIGGPL